LRSNYYTTMHFFSLVSGISAVVTIIVVAAMAGTPSIYDPVTRSPTITPPG
jgi:hypothetical protein